MKTSLKLIALVIAAGTPVVAFAQSAGVVIPAISFEAAFGGFITVLFALMFAGDYFRRSRSLAVMAPVIVPSAGSFAARSVRQERLAA